MSNGLTIPQLDPGDVILFGSLILFVFIMTVIGFFIGAYIRRKSIAHSPYSGLPLRRGSDLPYESVRKILQYMYEFHEYDNRIFNMRKAALCRETGRIFPNAITWLQTLHVDWRFLNKRYPGNYVSWGSLSDDLQLYFRSSVEGIEKFQLDKSSPEAAPSAVTTEYAFTKPGPLYVDVDKMVLLGWQKVPDSDFEVLIVKKAKKAS